ncbi:MAG TPA: potassium/proton antiporter, partial [bacterium]|nr:potassium/proton antiporter [bacterium]
LFLLVGILAGSEGLGGIYFDDYGLAKTIGIVALIFIIYYGGLDTAWKSVKPLLFPGLALSTFGVLVTAFTVGLFAMAILKFSPLEGLLLGSIVSSTDAAAVFSVLRSRRISLKGDLKALLELESGSNDPMAVFLTIALISLLTGENAPGANLLLQFALNMGLGLLAGYLMARLGVFVINRIKLEYEGLYQVLIAALILLTYSVANFSRGNGFLAVYVLGLMMSRSAFIHKRQSVRFYEGVAWLMQIAMFLTLGLLVFPSQIKPIIGPGLLISAMLIFLGRPISVFLCLLPFRFQFKEKVLISWVGLRGAVPVILATFPLLAGVAQAHTIFNIVFFVVLTSVLVQGTSIPVVSKRLGLDIPFDRKKRYPLELDETEGIEASLNDLIVPYNSAAVGQPIASIDLPPQALIVLISRAEHFIIPTGSTVIEAGDVLLVLGKDSDFSQVQATLSKLREPEEKSS